LASPWHDGRCPRRSRSPQAELARPLLEALTGAPAQAEPTALEHPQQARAELDRAMARADAELEPQPDLIKRASRVGPSA
jgi:hypothetical protein